MADAAQSFIQFDLVSPEKKLVSKGVTMVVIPGEEGEMGVLKEHTPVVTTLRHGVVKIYDTPNEQHPEIVFVDGGFADVTAGQCTILAEHAVKLPDIDQGELTAEVKKLHEDMQGASEGEELNKIRHRLDVALAKQEALSLHK